MDYKDILVISIVIIIVVVVSWISPNSPIGLMVKYVKEIFRRKQ